GTTRGLYPSRGSGAFEAHRLAADRMHEAEPSGVQAEPPELSGGPAVLSIADDGMPEGGQLGADLAPPSGAPAPREACRVLAAREHPVARDGRLAFRAACRADAEVPVLGEPALERRRVGAHVSLHERDVDALDGARLELGLEALLGFGRLGEHEEPGGLSVE